MLNLITCEGLKLKRSKILLLSIIGVFSTPCLMLAEALYTHFREPDRIFTLGDIYDSSLLYVMILTNLMIYVTITAYLFSREYGEGTLKTILPIPVRREGLLTAKFAILLIWVLLLTLVTWGGVLVLSSVYHHFFDLEGYSLLVAGEWLIRFLAGNLLIFLTMPVFAYIGIKAKGFVAPVMASSVIVMGGAALSNQDLGALYPWTGAFFLASGKLTETGYSPAATLGVILLVFLGGSLLTFRHFKREDIR